MISGSVLECSQNEMLTEHSKYNLLETMQGINAAVFRFFQSLFRSICRQRIPKIENPQYRTAQPNSYRFSRDSTLYVGNTVSIARLCRRLGACVTPTS